MIVITINNLSSTYLTRSARKDVDHTTAWQVTSLRIGWGTVSANSKRRVELTKASILNGKKAKIFLTTETVYIMNNVHLVQFKRFTFTLTSNGN